MKKILFFVTLLALTLMYTPGSAFALPIPGLFNTGVNATNTVLPFGTPDAHYSLVQVGVGAIIPMVIPKHPAWVTAPAGSSWIGPAPIDVGGPPNATYTYSTSFDLTGLDYTTASISGLWASDDFISLYLNGVDTGLPTQNFTALASFTISSNFVAGVNVLEFKVLNGTFTGINPTGLLVSNLHGTANSTNAVPEPSTLLLLGSGLVGLGFVRSKLRA